ncbi:MAG: hypothetical protein MMC23_002420 [Stictis urceolatum]|nr:hypothetical protein [Stictis urceolata]
MRFQVTSVFALAGLSAAAPYSPFPLADGFPNPSPAQIAKIQKGAGGTLPNGPLPPNPNSPAAALDLQVVAFNEIFEVAYFTQLLQNVTESKPGYEVPSKWGKSYVESLLKEIIQQEELHALLANTALKSYGGTPVTPAQYKFPVNNLLDALNFAGIFTSLVLGALQSVQTDLTSTKSAGLVQIVGSIIGQEGEQTGFYRAVNGDVPSASPFLTVAAGQFAYNALQQMVVVPGSNKNNIAIPAYDPLTVVGTPQPKNSTLHFETTGKKAPTSASYITYVTGQNVPVTEPISNIKSNYQGKTTFDAFFPFDAGFSNGLSIAAITSKGPFMNVSEVAAATSAGPGLIYIK